MSVISLSEAQTCALYQGNFLAIKDSTGRRLALPDPHAFGIASSQSEATVQVSAMLSFVQSQLAAHDHAGLHDLNEEASLGLSVILSVCRSLLSLPAQVE
ncbi:hypothetical protein [Gynuella sunshinyii]|uniref:Uncharacterized protein n=1 Tax=Gynuella sunshinyii YC6258 TaxID=1445510 RepID=A0A0C5VFA8_9GAMM|nr:hypothetical protein [Gynuella sunshinyii]AJQ92093.1 hypothetical Protein YC6258_00037 [Gynuella sunshinyii YC6258]